METLVTGGNGFVGHHLIRALIDRGDRIRVLALPEEDTSSLEQSNVDIYRGDIRDYDSLVPAVRGVDTVVHLAAMMHVWRPLADYRDVNVDGTVNVCHAAMAADVRRVVHMSSSSIYGMAWRGLVDETFPLAPFDDPYAVTKAEGDLAIQSMIARDGLRAVIIRPDQIFGPGDRLHFGEMADRLRAGHGIIVGRGDNYLPLVYVSDVVQALVLALDHSDALGEVFNITADLPMTQREFLWAVADETGGTRPRLRVPRSVLYPASVLAEGLAKIAGGTSRPPVTRLGVAFRCANVRFSAEKARRELGFEARVELRDGIRKTAEWYLSEVARPRAGSVVAAANPAPTLPIEGAARL